MILGLIQEAKYFNLVSMHKLEDLAICHCLRVPGVPRPVKTTSVVRWVPPPLGCYKLNVMGARKTVGFMLAVSSATLWDSLLQLSRALGRGIDLDAEILAGMHGVVFVHARGWTNLWVESDNALAIKVLLCDDKTVPWRIHPHWRTATTTVTSSVNDTATARHSL